MHSAEGPRETRRLRLTARLPIGTAETVVVVGGDDLDAGGLRIRVDEVHPWNPAGIRRRRPQVGRLSAP